MPIGAFLRGKCRRIGRAFSSLTGRAGGLLKNNNYRGVVGLLAFDAPKENSKKTKFHSLINQLEQDKKCIVITSDYFHFIIIGWESNGQKEMYQKNYCDWLKDLESYVQDKTGKSLKPLFLPRSVTKVKQAVS